MWLYDKGAASETRWKFGLELVGGLQQDSKTVDLVDGLQALNDELEAAETKTQRWEKEKIKQRVKIRWADHGVDQDLRNLAKQAEMADGVTGGPIYKALFPEGLNPVTKKPGRQQLQPAQDLIQQLDNHSLPAMKGFATAHSEPLRQATAALHTEVDAFNALEASQNEDFAAEKQVRDRHLRAIKKLKGNLQHRFPDSPQRIKLIWPASPSRKK